MVRFHPEITHADLTRFNLDKIRANLFGSVPLV
jgi:hypothetical protein